MCLGLLPSCQSLFLMAFCPFPNQALFKRKQACSISQHTMAFDLNIRQQATCFVIAYQVSLQTILSKRVSYCRMYECMNIWMSGSVHTHTQYVKNIYIRSFTLNEHSKYWVAWQNKDCKYVKKKDVLWRDGKFSLSSLLVVQVFFLP